MHSAEVDCHQSVLCQSFFLYIAKTNRTFSMQSCASVADSIIGGETLKLAFAEWGSSLLEGLC